MERFPLLLTLTKGEGKRLVALIAEELDRRIAAGEDDPVGGAIGAALGTFAAERKETLFFFGGTVTS